MPPRNVCAEPIALNATKRKPTSRAYRMFPPIRI
jgi:hypothetical protein